MTGLKILTAARMVAGCLCLALSGLVSGQEALVKAEALVRAQTVPLSRPMTFEQAYPGEMLDYIGWLMLRTLDSSSAWTPNNRGWNLYRVNLAIDLEEKLRIRWQAASGTVRSLSQTPETSLAKHLADSLTPDELGEILAFYQSASGKKFLTYQNELRGAYYRGKLVFEKLRFDPAFGPVSQSTAELRRNWLAKNSLPPEATSEAYSFHAQALQRIFPGVPMSELVFDLAAGAVPGTPAMARLSNALTHVERDAVRQFLKSTASAKELAAIKVWQDSVAKTLDLLPLWVGDIRSLANVSADWQQIRANPESLPRSIAKIDVASIKIPETLALARLDDSGASKLKQCLPSTDDSAVKRMERFIEAKTYLTESTYHYSPATPAVFVTRGAYGACVSTTSGGYPVLSVDSFAGSISVVGMSDAENREWLSKVAQHIAAEGRSESLVALQNGNAFEVTYAVDARSPSRLLYKTRFLLAGT